MYVSASSNLCYKNKCPIDKKYRGLMRESLILHCSEKCVGFQGWNLKMLVIIANRRP